MPGRKKIRPPLFGSAARKMSKGRGGGDPWDGPLPPWMPDPGDRYQIPDGFYQWDFTNTAQWTASGYVNAAIDQYGNQFDVLAPATQAYAPWVFGTNDAEQQIDVRQVHTDGGYARYKYSSIVADCAKLKGQMQIDMAGSTDTGHSVRWQIYGGVGDFVEVQVLGNGIFQGKINGTVRINLSGISTGNVTIAFYIDGSNLTIKAVNGFNDNYSWTLWDGSDSTQRGTYAQAWSPANKDWELKSGNDTSPLTHGWIRKASIMCPTYSGWVD